MMCEYRRKLDQLKPETRLEVGPNHFQVIASTCLQLRSLASCAYQKTVFEQVERLMILGQSYTEHIGADPFPWPEDDAFLAVADTHCRQEHSLVDKVEMWEVSAKNIFWRILRPLWISFWMEWWNAEILCLHAMTTFTGSSSNARPWRRTTIWWCVGLQLPCPSSAHHLATAWPSRGGSTQVNLHAA